MLRHAGFPLPVHHLRAMRAIPTRWARVSRQSGDSTSHFGSIMSSIATGYRRRSNFLSLMPPRIRELCRCDAHATPIAPITSRRRGTACFRRSTIRSDFVPTRTWRSRSEAIEVIAVMVRYLSVRRLRARREVRDDHRTSLILPFSVDGRRGSACLSQPPVTLAKSAMARS
jgi:hypothetical protein